LPCIKIFFLSGTDYFSVRKYHLFYQNIIPGWNRIILVNSSFFLCGTNSFQNGQGFSLSAHIFSILADILPYKQSGKVKGKREGIFINQKFFVGGSVCPFFEIFL